MMAAKRKRGNATTTTDDDEGTTDTSLTSVSPSDANPQKAQGESTGSAADAEVDDREYKVKQILQENRRKYLIAWEDDEVTGEKFEPTWEPKEYANELAVTDWKERKKGRSGGTKRVGKRKASSKDGDADFQSPARTPARKKVKRVIESSPLSTPANGTTNGHSQDENDPEPEIGETQPAPTEEEAADSPLFVSEATSPTPSATAAEGLVQLSQPPSSYQRGAYQRFDSSQLQSAGEQTSSAVDSSASDPAQSSFGSGVSQLRSTAEQVNSSTSGPANSISGRVIPDSDPSSGSLARSQFVATQAGSVPSTAQVVPESQSQLEHESSSFRGFSPDRTADATSSAGNQAAASEQRAPTESQLRGPLPTQDSPPSTNEERDIAAAQSSEEAQNAGTTVIAATETDRRQQAEPEEADQHGGSRPETSTAALANGVATAEGPKPGTAEEQDTSGPESAVHSDRELEAQPQGPAEESSGQESSHDTSDAADDLLRASLRRHLEQASPAFITQERPLSDRPREIETGSRVDPPSQTAESRPQIEQEPSQTRRPSSPAKSRRSSDEEIRVEPPGSIERRRQQAQELAPTQGSPTSAAASTDRRILIDSSEVPASSRQFLSQPDYDPPPAGQRPVPSSAPNGTSVFRSRGPQPASPLAATSSQSDSEQSPPSNFPTSLPRGTHRTPIPHTQKSPRFQTQPSNNLTSNSEDRREANNIFSPQRNPGRRRPIDFQRRAAPDSIRRRAAARSPESSPFPSVPSQSIGTVGESAPGPIPSPSQMSSQTPVGSRSNVRETPARTRAMQTPVGQRQGTPSRMPEQPATSLPANVLAEVEAARQGSPMLDGGRSPSAVPAVEAVPEVTQEEMNTSERYDTLLPQAHENSNGSGSRHGHGASTNSERQPHPEEPNEEPEAANAYTVPVVLAGHQRDQYFQNIYYQHRAIDWFLGERRPNAEQIEIAEGVIERLRAISMHPDMVNQDTLSQVSTPERQAQWDVDASAKFHFLNRLFEQLQGRNMHVALVAAGDRVPDMLETFLQGTHIPYNRDPSARADFHSANLGLRVSIISLEQDPASVDGAHLVIAMDGSGDYRHPVIQSARQHRRVGQDMTDTNAWALLLTLVVPCTIEHIERCLAPGMSQKARITAILGATRRIKENAGKAEAGQAFPKEAALAVAEFLTDADAADWPLAGLSMIEDLDSQTETEMDFSARRTRSRSPGRRPLADVDPASPENPNKRPRLGEPGPSGTIDPRDMDTSHVSDSMGRNTQSNLERTGVAHEEPLWPGQEEAQALLAQYEKDLGEVQLRAEDQRHEIFTIKKERDDAIARAENALSRLSVTDTNNQALREQRTALKEQLEEANQRLREHTVPERQELENVRQEAAQLRAEKEKIAKKLETTEAEIIYVREMYQESSNRARDLYEDNEELKARVTSADEAASGEQARAQQMSNDARFKALERENKRLKTLLKDREANLRARDEELVRLKEAGRGRMGTRNSSVPRSPRLGSPVAPARGQRSRQASPSAGELRPRGGMHPLRNG